MIETLPKGWTIAKLGELCEIIMGQSPPSETYNNSAIGPPFFQGKKEFTELHPIVEKWCSAPNKIAEVDDILISVRAPVGDTNIANQKCCIGRGLAAIRYSFDNKYILYYLKLIKEQLNEKGTGTTFKAISGDLLKQTTIPLAPLPEQTRILAKLEKLLTDLDKGIEYLETTKQQLKVYRQAVLKWAFEGRLNRDSSDNDDKHDLNNQDKRNQGNHTNQENQGSDKGELPDGWQWKQSGELFSFVTSGSRGWAKYYSNNGAIFIRITNLNFDSIQLDLRPQQIQYVKPPSNSEGQRTKVQEGDFLFSITGYLGMFAIAPNLDNAYVNQHVCLCRPKDFFNKKFVAYWIISKSGAHYHLNKNQKGAVKAGLNLDDIKSFPVPLPDSIYEQKKIVSAIESRLSVCDKIEETIESSLQQADALRLSIIKKAFEGKLVPQDPNDEPAEKLLERIRAAKSNTQKMPEASKRSQLKNESK